MIEYKVKGIIDSPDLSDVEMLGSVGEQMMRFFDERIFSDFAKNTVYTEAEDAYKNCIDDLNAAGIWQGEFWGKWIIGACHAAKYKHDSEMKEFLRNAAYGIMKYQREDGYIGTYRDSKNVFAPDPEEAQKIVGWKCTWNWNVWCRKYTLWGLIEIYRLVEDRKILDAAVRLADHLIGELHELGVSIHDVGTAGFVGLPPASILKPMLTLYRITEDEKYYNFAVREIADRWESEDGRMPNLIKNALDGIPTHEWYPNSNIWAKAYEMMSCFEGIIELYRICGEEKYLRAAKNFYDNIKKYEYNAIGGISCNDQFYNAAEYQNNCTEPCDTIHWMRLGYELFRLSGDSKYMDDIEDSFYNPFLAGSMDDGKWGARAVRTSGRHMVVHDQARMKYSHCCVNNMPRGYMNFAESQIMASEDELYINMYTDFRGSISVAGKPVLVSVGGSYLSDGRVQISIIGEGGYANLRIPSFSKTTEIHAAGKVYKTDSSGYFRLPTDAGECRIEVQFDMNPRIIDFAGADVEPAEDDYVCGRFKNVKDTNIPYEDMFFGRRSTLRYGPLLLTRSKKCGNREEEMFGNNKTVCGGGYRAEVTPVKPNGTRTKFKVKFDNGKDSFETVMCDFATGSNEYSIIDARIFEIWV